MIEVLNDDDVTRIFSMKQAIDTIEQALRAKHNGSLTAPPRFSVDGENGSLVFTAGAESENSQVIGFRVYDMFAGETHPPHLVAVYNGKTGHLKGIVVGEMIGAMRTAAINALAIRCLSRENATSLGVLGTGLQAGVHTHAASLVRNFEKIAVFSPNADHRRTFAEKLSAKTGLGVRAVSSAEAVVREADVLICATNSRTPVLDAAWVSPGMHINTIGPKLTGAHEIPVALAKGSDCIVTDSMQQVDAFASAKAPFFLEGTPDRERMLELDDIIVGKRRGRSSPSDLTLFCSVGLAGTEVVLADEVLKQHRRQP